MAANVVARHCLADALEAVAGLRSDAVPWAAERPLLPSRKPVSEHRQAMRLEEAHWMWTPEIARAITRRWISLVPSKIV